MERDEIYMKRCLELAELGLGKTYPNPMVGSVIVHKGEIIGEGWHQKAGEAHAEVNAVNSVVDKSLLKESTIYVNLEPCSHYGKTPPCADLIIQHQIPKVVIGCVDSFSEVSGKGIERLKQAGAEVSLGVLERQCKLSHRRFFTFHEKKRPYIILKWAQTKDGFIAPNTQAFGKPFWISSKASKQLVHRWRTEEAAILVGSNTAKKDNPALTARMYKGEQPLRIVIDRALKLSKQLAIFDESAQTIVYTEQNRANTDGSNIIYQKIDFENLHQNILDDLYQRNIQSLIIEGGRYTLQSFIDEQLWDEARVFMGESELADGIAAPTLSGRKTQVEKIAVDSLKYIYR